MVELFPNNCKYLYQEGQELQWLKHCDNDEQDADASLDRLIYKGV